MNPKTSRFKQALKWVLGGLPLAVAIGTSCFSLQVWMQQALILVVLLWLQAFVLLSVFSLGN